MEKLDYTPHYLNAKKHLNEIYQLLNNNKLSEGLVLLDELFADVRMMQLAVKSRLD